MTPASQPVVVGAPPQLGLGDGQLRAVVDALRLGGVVGRERTDVVARVVQDGDHIGEVVLALGVVGRQTRAARDRAGCAGSSRSMC